jgi:hypothetical protein
VRFEVASFVIGGTHLETSLSALLPTVRTLFSLKFSFWSIQCDVFVSSTTLSCPCQLSTDSPNEAPVTGFGSARKRPWSQKSEISCVFQESRAASDVQRPLTFVAIVGFRFEDLQIGITQSQVLNVSKKRKGRRYHSLKSTCSVLESNKSNLRIQCLARSLRSKWGNVGIRSATRFGSNYAVSMALVKMGPSKSLPSEVNKISIRL